MGKERNDVWKGNGVDPFMWVVRKWQEFVQSIRKAPRYWWLLLMAVLSLSLLISKNDKSFIQHFLLARHAANSYVAIYICA